MATYTDPKPKYETTDWFTKLHQLSTNAENKQNASERVRQEARCLRNETDNLCKWGQYENNNRLSDRIDAIRKWKAIMEKTKEELDEEIEALSRAKDDAERALEDLNINKDVNTENLTSRDGRREIDNVNDEPEQQLTKEKCVIEKVKRDLQKKIDDCFEQLCRMQEARHNVVEHINNKGISLDVDIDLYNMNEKSPMSFKPDPKRIPKKTLTAQEWEDIARYVVDRANDEKDEGQRLREATHHALHQKDNDLGAQKEAADFALRKRIHEEDRAKDHLEWRKKNMEKEMDELIKDLHGLEEAIRAKLPFIRKAETRLEKRHFRPEGEVVMDSPEYGLRDELQELYNTKKALEDKQARGRNALDELEKELNRVKSDIARKANSLMLDGACVDTRTRLETKPMTRSDCNLMSKGVIRERSKVVQ